MLSGSSSYYNDGTTDGISIDKGSLKNQVDNIDRHHSVHSDNDDVCAEATVYTDYHSVEVDHEDHSICVDSDGHSVNANSDDYSVVDKSDDHNRDDDNSVSVNPNNNNSVDTLDVLMDISCDKNWICYVRQSWDDAKEKITTTLIRREFVALDAETKNPVKVAPVPEQTNAIDGATTIDVDFKDITLDITEYYLEDEGFTKFLSISADGKYIALSYYKELNLCKDEKSTVEKNNLEYGLPGFIVFKVEDGSIMYDRDVKCNGRAVFLKRKDELCLAVIDDETIVIFSNICQTTKNLTTYDLAPFALTFRNYFRDPYFLLHPSWINVKNILKKIDVVLIMDFSKHIRHDLLATYSQNVLRLRSIKQDGIRLTLLEAPDEWVLTISRDHKYVATMKKTSISKIVKIYNNKTSSLIHTLKSSYNDHSSSLEVTHARFCYNSRYFALSGIQNIKNDRECIAKVNIVFEIWDIGTEKSIYRIVAHSADAPHISKSKTVKPFVLRGTTDDGRKCLKGVYSVSDGQNNNRIYYLELKMDDDFASTRKQVKFKWISNNHDYAKCFFYEIGNRLKNYTHLKCAKIIVGKKKYLLRCGMHMIQLWMLGNQEAVDETEKKDRLVYIRAYKGPTYGLAYSFRKDWQIHDFESIKFVGGMPVGRMLVNITEYEPEEVEEEQKNLHRVYHTEEIFLPLVDSSDEDSNIFDYHTFESACQALHSLSEDNVIDLCGKKGYDKTAKESFVFPLEIGKTVRSKQYVKNVINLYQQTKEIIINVIKRKNSAPCAYFTTVAGSRTLTMLASFGDGREIIKMILKREAGFPICIFSYARSISDYYSSLSTDQKVRLRRTRQPLGELQTEDAVIDYRNSPTVNEVIEGDYSPIAANENVLTVLIEKLDYDLYNLMFNRVLSDSKKIGPGCLSALTDALLYLQEEGNTDLLLSSGRKLSYLSVEKKALHLSNKEMEKFSADYDQQTGFVSNIRNLKSFSLMEQVPSYKNNWWNALYVIYVLMIVYLRRRVRWIDSTYVFYGNQGLLHAIKLYIIFFFRGSYNASKEKYPKSKVEICVVPLLYFNTYDVLCEDRFNNTVSSNNIYKKRSAFVAVASDPNITNIFKQGDTVLEVMLQHKWKSFVRNRFIAVCIIHIAYYISYCTGVLFAFEMYGYDSADKGRSISAPHWASIIIMSLSGLVLFGQEIHQICKSERKMIYFKSGYNWVDLVALVLPFITLLQLRYNWNKFYELCSVSTLILWLHGVLRLRVFSFVGIALEIIIQLAQRVWSILFILLLVVFGFTHSFIVLFRRREDEYFQEHFNGTTTLNTEGNTSLYDISSSNGFNDPFKAFYQVWLLIFGVWDPITNGDAGDDRMLFVFCILFAFITVLIFSNIVIAIMASVVDEVKRKGNAVWVNHFASVVAEIEQLWCFPSTKRDRNNNPAYIYYLANYQAVQKQEKMLADETKELRKKVLGIDDDDKRPKCNCQMSSVDS